MVIVREKLSSTYKVQGILPLHGALFSFQNRTIGIKY